MSYINKAVEGAYQYFPANEPPIGSTLSKDVYPQNEKIPKLFEPLTIRGTTFNNRIFVSPMCQYSCRDGQTTDWHFVHIGGFATRGYGAVCMEATAVVPEGRISPEDVGLWDDSHIPALERIVRFAHTHGAKVGIQLAHAGRKSSSLTNWVAVNSVTGKSAPSRTAHADENGWPDNVQAPSEIPFSPQYPLPKAMTEEDLQRVEEAFVAAVGRCKTIGFDFIEIHGSHGYLLHEFLSPLSNHRTDQYGGSLENRLRYPLRVVRAVRAAWADKPLFVRISASDEAAFPERDDSGTWRQWGIEQSKLLVGELHTLGVDLVDCSSGGNWAEQHFDLRPGYQVPYAEALKKAHPNIIVGAVGLITDAHQAEEYLQEGKADVVLLAREAIRSPHWPANAATQLGVVIKVANQYERGYSRMLVPKKPN